MANPADDAKNSLNDIKSLTNAISEGFNDIAKRISGVVEELAEAQKELNVFNNVTNDINRSLRNVSRTNEDLIRNQIKLNQGKLSTKEVDEQINKIVATRQVLSSRLANLQDALNKEGEISLEQQEEILKLQTQIKNINDEVLVNFQQQRVEAEKIQKSLGLVSKVSGEIKSRTRDYVKEITSASFIVDFLIKQFQRVDSGVGQLAKDFNMSYEGALKTRQELTQIASLSGNAAINTRGLQESMVAIGQSLGSNAKLNKEDLITFTELREVAGYTNDELIGIQKLTLATGGNLKDNTKQFLGTVSALNAQNKLTINEKQLLKEVANVSDAIKLSVGGTTAALAKSAFQAKQFGINLEQADQIAEGLLDFEQSINAQLEAELLTGRALNLDKARLLALNGDIAGASAEILQQIGGSAEFTKMNRIQQEALAKAVGLTRDDLAKSLIEREALQKIGVKDADAAKKKFDALVKQYGYDKAVKMLGDEQYGTQLKQQSIQEKFNQAMEKLQDIIGNLVNGPFGAFLEGLSKGLDYIGKIFAYFGKIGALVKQFFGDKVGGFLGDIASVAAIGGLIALVAKSMLKGTIFNPMIVKDIGGGGGGGMMDMFGGGGKGRGPRGGGGGGMFGNIFKGGRAGQVARGRTLQGAGKLAKGAGWLSLLGTGIDLTTNLMDEKRSTGNALAKTLDQNKFTALGAGIGALFGGVGAIPGAAIGGILDWALGDATKIVEDGVIGPDGGLKVSGPKGTFSLDKKDTVIAGTDLDKKPSTPTSGGGNNLTIEELRAIRTILADTLLVNKEIATATKYQSITSFAATSISDLGTKMNMNTYKTQ